MKTKWHCGGNKYATCFPPNCHRIWFSRSREGGDGGWRWTEENMPPPPLPHTRPLFQIKICSSPKRRNLTLPTTQESLHTKPSVTQQVVTREKKKKNPQSQHSPLRGGGGGGGGWQCKSVLLFFPFFSSFVSFFFLSEFFSTPTQAACWVYVVAAALQLEPEAG